MHRFFLILPLLVYAMLLILPVKPAAAAAASMPSGKCGLKESRSLNVRGVKSPADSLDPGRPLSLEQAIALALARNPAVRAASEQILAQEARISQEGIYPNPELGLDLENFGGPRDFAGISGMETTVMVSQPIVIAGKIRKRVRVAALDRDIARWERERMRLDVTAQVKKAFTEVIIAQKRVALKAEMVTIAKRFLSAIRRRIEAGKTSPVEAARAQVELSARRLELERARGQLRAARKRLAATWGGKNDHFTVVAGRFEELTEVPSLESLLPYIPDNPDLARLNTSITRCRAAVDLEDARRFPDPVVSLGYRRMNDTDAGTFLAAVSVPLPFFDRNQGARSEARHLLIAARAQREAAAVEITARLAGIREELANAYMRISRIRDTMIPGAEESYKTIREGYLQGRFTFIDVLDAQRTLFAVRSDYLESLGEYHRFRADLERLIARSLESIAIATP